VPVFGYYGSSELDLICVYQVIRIRGSRSDEAENIANSTLLLSDQHLIHQHESTRNNLNLREQSIISLEGIRLRETTSDNANSGFKVDPGKGEAKRGKSGVARRDQHATTVAMCSKTKHVHAFPATPNPSHES